MLLGYAKIVMRKVRRMPSRTMSHGRLECLPVCRVFLVVSAHSTQLRMARQHGMCEKVNSHSSTSRYERSLTARLFVLFSTSNALDVLQKVNETENWHSTGSDERFKRLWNDPRKSISLHGYFAPHPARARKTVVRLFSLPLCRVDRTSDGPSILQRFICRTSNNSFRQSRI